MINVPRTMTKDGLRFLKELASVKRAGVYLEIGPLFGSSTCFINAGRKQALIEDTIHSIDTFEAAPWIEKRFGFNLSIVKFKKFTDHINNLEVHQGFSPNVVEKTWNKSIGFYFDDATHGNPGWIDNFNFFKNFFEDDAIICGDDFAGGWPDIPQNVYKICSEYNCKLHVIGRVWAITKQDDYRISQAIDKLFPKITDVTIKFSRRGEIMSGKAASWTYGLHTKIPLEWVEITSNSKRIKIITMLNGVEVSNTSNSKSKFMNINSILIQGEKSLSVQYCICDSRGRTSNTKEIPFGVSYSIPKNNFIVSIRITHR